MESRKICQIYQVQSPLGLSTVLPITTLRSICHNKGDSLQVFHVKTPAPFICGVNCKAFHQGPSSFQGHPTMIFGKNMFGTRFEIQNFRDICCKISCLPASPRIFELLKKGIIAHLSRIFTLKRSPRIFGSLFSN